MQRSENIYENVFFHAPESTRTGSALSGAKDGKRRPCRAAAVCLGLLCLLLLSGLITLVFLFTKSNSDGKMEMILLQSRNNNLTKEKDQLQTRYNNLMKEKDQLQTSYNNLMKEKDQLQTSYKQPAAEKDHQQKRFDALTTDRNDPQQNLQATTSHHINLDLVSNQESVDGRRRIEEHVSSDKKKHL